MYRLKVLDSATKELASLDRPVARRIAKKLRWLAESFESIRPEPLVGDLATLNKLRVGDYRVIYEVLADERMLVIHAVGHRREIYRQR